MKASTGEVQVVSRRVVRPEPATSPDGAVPPEPETMHLTPWDLRMLTVDYIHKGLLLPKPQTGAESPSLVDGLASSFARALSRFYPLAGRLTVVTEAAAGEPDPGIVVSLRCSGDGAEFVHAVAPEVTASDIAAADHYIPPVVWSLFPLNGVLGADVSRPVLGAQVTELADGVFLAVSLNHAVGDGTTFWHFINTWSEMSRRSSCSDAGVELSTPPPVLDRWFLDGCPVPIRLPFAIVRRPVYPPVRECFFHFSPESVMNLKAKANAEMAGGKVAATISSLQALLAHTWRAVCRARELTPERETPYILYVGCRGRVRGISQGYMGNTVTDAVAKSTAGEVVGKGLGWAAWLMNRAVAALDEASVREDLASWLRSPRFLYEDGATAAATATIATGSSPRFDVFGNDFGWGWPVAVRSGAGNKMDGKVTVYEGRGGGMALEVCLSPGALARLVADEEFMEAVSAATA
ncbi:hypothetical protein HU200_021753 [Digitaria exilis]|uniref:Uncharacterized protein n=1 Tax=Digitaria exilis TaxID=1010633 RepID=A0A835EZQ4_9POAL|nr:hypothetical protein HU200_021753 [Digitaria exilis]